MLSGSKLADELWLDKCEPLAVMTEAPAVACASRKVSRARTGLAMACSGNVGVVPGKIRHARAAMPTRRALTW